MTPTNQGSIRLFRLAGIDLYLHWSWFLVAYYAISIRSGHYTSITWNVLEYLALFGIVMLHEFGHSLACRQVGGQADRIVLWPLGGVAYVQPPQRPGATLWSIAAGPLVNVVLGAFFIGLGTLTAASDIARTAPNLLRLIWTVGYINIGLLIFNLLPIYPLDGGQILRSLLWFVLGRAKSLLVATSIGLLGVVGLILLAISARSVWMGILAAFILLNCWNGLKHALQLNRMAKALPRAGVACPACRQAPPTGTFWTCGRCQTPFDMFENAGACLSCGVIYAGTHCFDCGAGSPIADWSSPPSETPLYPESPPALEGLAGVEPDGDM